MLMTGFVTEHIVGEAIGVPGSPFFAMVAVIVYGIMANICFTAGWILELLSRRIWGSRAEAFGEIAFTWGTLGSVLLTLVPAGLTVTVGAYRILASGWKNQSTGLRRFRTHPSRYRGTQERREMRGRLLDVQSERSGRGDCHVSSQKKRTLARGNDGHRCCRAIAMV
jgi:hypothetical protein